MRRIRPAASTVRLLPLASRVPYRREEESSVSILCQHHELRDDTMCQTGHEGDAAKLLKMLPT